MRADGNVCNDLPRVLGPGIVAGNDDPVRQTSRNLAHYRTFAGIAIAAATEYAMQFRAGWEQITQCLQHFFECVRRVRIVDHDQRRIRETYHLQSAGHGLHERKRIHRILKGYQRIACWH